jgi:predicted lipoprotein with Yx(FWY)xxD motif
MVKPGFPPAARVAAGLSAVALLALASACSSGKSSTASSSSPPSSASSPSGSQSSAPSTSGGAGTTVNSAMVTVGGAQTTVLTAPDGHTLYFFTPDTAGGKPTCTGGCASIWPALTATSPTEASGATGTLSVVNGQVVYNGHPLYEYSGDTAAGQTNGEGIMGKWYAATPALAAGADTMPAGSPSSSGSSSGGSGGGGY